MANEQNLKPVRNSEEAKQRGRNGGKASGEARRRRKSLKDLMEIALTCEPDARTTNAMLRKGIDKEDLTVAMAISIALAKEAMKGNVAAVKQVAELVGESPEKALKLIGQVTIEDNRQALQDFADQIFGDEDNESS